jgi:SAM-dependent methyltransferase
VIATPSRGSPYHRSAPRFDPGSFRDRDGRVVADGERVLRVLSPRALDDWRALAATAFFRRSVEDGKIVATREVDDAPEEVAAGWAGVLEHERVPFVSYPYEWSFGMLREGALLELDLLLAALEEDLVLKDASAFNVQWRGSCPVFIDVPSFQRLAPGEPWAGYRQFCQMFLYPLFLQSYRRVRFQPWLRGTIDGISPAECRGLLSLRDLFRPGVFLHVWLQAKLQTRYADSRDSVRQTLREAGFRKEAIQANARGLRKLVDRLRWEPPPSVWSGYTTATSYADADRERKAAFVERVTGARRRRLVWDLGCNTGVFSRMAAANADAVVALDADPVVIERLHRELVAESDRTILPLVCDLADPSPGLGWRGAERQPLVARGRPDLVLCLALIHHVVLGANVVLDDFVEWLRELGAELVIEFVGREDPMVRRLLRDKEDAFADYDAGHFEHVLEGAFEVRTREVLPSGNRILFHATPR